MCFVCEVPSKRQSLRIDSLPFRIAGEHQQITGRNQYILDGEDGRRQSSREGVKNQDEIEEENYGEEPAED